MSAELITAVRVDQPGVGEAHFQVMQQRRLVQVAESGQVIQTLQNVWVSQRWEAGLLVYLVLRHLRRQKGKVGIYFLKIGHKEITLAYARIFFPSLLLTRPKGAEVTHQAMPIWGLRAPSGGAQHPDYVCREMSATHFHASASTYPCVSVCVCLVVCNLPISPCHHPAANSVSNRQECNL